MFFVPFPGRTSSLSGFFLFFRSHIQLPPVVSTADLIANMLALGLLTSVPSDPLNARSSKILGLKEHQILQVIAELPERVMDKLSIFDTTFFTTSPVFRSGTEARSMS